MDEDIHPTVIIGGFRKALEQVIEVLDRISIDVSIEDIEILRKVAGTSMSSKAIGNAAEHFSEIAVEAVRMVAEKRGEEYYVDKDNIQIVKKEGRGLEETELIKGSVLDKEVVHPGMPKRVDNAKIALVNSPLEVEKTEFDAEIRIRDPSHLQAYLDQETRLLEKMVEQVKNAGSNVLLCQKGIDDIAQHLLAKAGILSMNWNRCLSVVQ